jgi:outer membrane protein assembly factor BamB
MSLKQLWKTEFGGVFMASPVYRDGLIYTIESQKCRLHIIDAKTGASLTTTRVVDDATKAEKIEPGSKIDGLSRARYSYASPAAADGKLFFFDDAGTTAVLELGREYKLARLNKLDDGMVGTPFFINDKIVIRGTQAIYCIGEKN